MKKTIWSLVLGFILAGIYIINDYVVFWRNCLGCGIAPDGLTDLGPNKIYWFYVWLFLAVVLFFIFRGAFYLFQKFRKK